MEIMTIVWLVLLVLFIVFEGVTSALVSIWFCIGSLASLLVSLIFPEAILAQIIVFVVVSALAVVALRPLAKRYVTNKKVPTNADANIGKVCQVLTEVQPSRFGRVKVEGKEWTAKSDYTLPVGSWCRIDAIEGVKLVVSPLPQTAPPQNTYTY